MAGLTISDQMFEEKDTLEFIGPLDGEIGLGFPLPGQDLIIAKMVEQKLINKPLFSFFISRYHFSYTLVYVHNYYMHGRVYKRVRLSCTSPFPGTRVAMVVS